MKELTGIDKLFQSTPPRGGRLSRWIIEKTKNVVSIHAPARGATVLTWTSRPSRPVSIHAPARGATGRPGRTPSPTAGFNPRPRAGGDGPWFQCPAAFHVSIHAPARGATSRTFAGRQFRRRFNPRPRAGGDRPGYPQWQRTSSFNPRPRAGGDYSAANCSPQHPRFQSTPPRGGRHSGATCASRFQRFQSTPPRGGRLKGRMFEHDMALFQSTPPRGGRRFTAASVLRPNSVSIHAPARGATRWEIPGHPGEKVLIHAPARGATFAWFRDWVTALFQSTPPRGGRPGSWQRSTA